MSFEVILSGPDLVFCTDSTFVVRLGCLGGQNGMAALHVPREVVSRGEASVGRTGRYGAYEWTGVREHVLPFAC